MSKPHIHVEDVTIGWGSIILMKEVNFDIQRGSCFAILGGSGCGKSTLLRHMIGLETVKSGTIHIDGWGAPRLPDGAPPFGIMYQSGALFGSLTLMENCLVPLRTWSSVTGATARELVQAKLELVGLGSFGNHLPGEISGGMKKRAAIARAMVLEPELLFFDEPSAGLDPISAVELDDLMRTLVSEMGITVVMVTHELESIFRVADECIVLERASQGVIAQGDPRELRDHSSIAFVHNFFNRSSPLEKGDS